MLNKRRVSEKVKLQKFHKKLYERFIKKFIKAL